MRGGLGSGLGTRVSFLATQESTAAPRPGSVFPAPRRRARACAPGRSGPLTFLPSPSDERAGAHGEFVPTKREGAEHRDGAGRKAQAGQ